MNMKGQPSFSSAAATGSEVSGPRSKSRIARFGLKWSSNVSASVPVRFRELPLGGPRRSFAAWFEPEHNTLEPGSAFFVNRFVDMDWLIATPRLTARFQSGRLTFGPGGAKPDLPEDASEALWATYFANIFNPARIKLDAMRSEMPKKYWKNLPETRLIPAMLADAEARVQRMRDAGASEPRPGAAPVSTRYREAMPQSMRPPERWIRHGRRR